LKGAARVKDTEANPGRRQDAARADVLRAGPPAPFAEARHLALRDQLEGWLHTHGRLLEGDATHVAVDDRAAHALLLSFGAADGGEGTVLGSMSGAEGSTSDVARAADATLWRTLFADLTRDRAEEPRNVTALALTRELVAPRSARADALLGVQGLVTLALHASRQHAPRGASALAALRLQDDIREGRALGAFALTEPEGGSDLASLRTTAQRRGQGFVLSGRKTFVSCAGLAAQVLVLARTAEAGVRGLSLFLVPLHGPEASRVSVRPLALLAPHDIGEVTFHDVPLPEHALLGRENEGFSLVREALTVMRPTVGAAALGLAGRALREARAFLSQRVAFGRPLAENETLRARLADHVAELTAMRLLVYRATWLADRTTPEERGELAHASSVAKLYATEAAQRIVDDALQMHGGQGVLVGSTVERLYREVRALRLYEGTSEIQRALVARSLFGR